MLSITILNCDDVLVEYIWKSKEEFVKDMDSDKIDIPMLDDFVTQVITDDERLNDWLSDLDGDIIVNDLYVRCMQTLNIGTRVLCKPKLLTGTIVRKFNETYANPTGYELELSTGEFLVYGYESIKVIGD